MRTIPYILGGRTISPLSLLQADALVCLHTISGFRQTRASDGGTQIHRLVLAIVFSLVSSFTNAQIIVTDYPEIYAIKVVGNDVTNENLILREMKLAPGKRADPELLEADRFHLLSLGVFNHVELTIISDLGRAVVLVRVTERFYIYPYPIFRYDPKNPLHRVYGIIVSHYNYRGYAERLSFGWWDGYERGMYILHRDPWFSIGGKYGLRTHIIFNDVEVTSPEGIAYRAATESFALRLQKRLGRDRWVGLEGEWQERSSKGPFYTLSESGRDRLLIGRIYYETEKRNYVYYPRKGYYFTFVSGVNHMVDTTHAFYDEHADWRIYRSFGRITLALRSSGQLTQKTIPWYRKPELATSELRSNSALGLKGTSYFSTNFEVRFNIMPIRYFSFGEIPLAGRYLQKLKFSLEGLLFLDRGYLDYTEGTHYSGFTACGFGLQFQLPYVEAGHVLVGWDPETRSHPMFLVRSGVTF